MNNDNKIPRTFFISDTHFGHGNIIKYSNRPFQSVNEMDETLISNWNQRVRPQDLIYHLGDFAFATEERICQILDRLNGQKFFIKGNHDKQLLASEKAKKKFVKVIDYLEISVKDPDVGSQKIILCHYPMITWNKAHHGSWMLHGHCHGNLKYPFQGRILDMGVDPNGYFPVLYDEVKRKMNAIKTPEFLDHHVGD